MPDPGGGNLFVIVPELDLEEWMPDGIVGLLADVFDEPRLGWNLIEPTPLLTVSRPQDVQAEAKALGPRNGRESEQIPRSAEWIVPAMVKKGGASLTPVQTFFEAEFLDEAQKVRIGPTDEMIEALDRMILEAKGAGEAAKIRRRFEQCDMVSGSNKITSGSDAREPTADDCDAPSRPI